MIIELYTECVRVKHGGYTFGFDFLSPRPTEVSLICDTKLSLAFYNEEEHECACLGRKSLGRHRGRRKMLLGLKSFGWHVRCFEMIVCVWEHFENVMQFPCGDPPPPPPAVYHGFIPTGTGPRARRSPLVDLGARHKRISPFDCVIGEKAQEAVPGAKRSH